MIQANELRIGNYLMAADQEYKGKIFAIDVGDIKHIKEGMQTYKYKPVELTPEIIVACGFRLDSTSHWKCGYNETERLDSVYSESIYGGYEPNMHIEVFSDPKTGKIRRIGIKGFTYDQPYSLSGSPYDLKYLHQLQNLYFALTGKELNYQP